MIRNQSNFSFFFFLKSDYRYDIPFPINIIYSAITIYDSVIVLCRLYYFHKTNKIIYCVEEGGHSKNERKAASVLSNLHQLLSI